MKNTIEPTNTIDIPRIENNELYKKNKVKYDENYNEFYGACACCGKGIKEPKFLLNTIWGGSIYLANDQTEYDDAWTMPIGSECVKRIPTEYVIKVGL
jgi:hypothetical protein